MNYENPVLRTLNTLVDVAYVRNTLGLPTDTSMNVCALYGDAIKKRSMPLIEFVQYLKLASQLAGRSDLTPKEKIALHVVKEGVLTGKSPEKAAQIKDYLLKVYRMSQNNKPQSNGENEVTCEVLPNPDLLTHNPEQD
jgi:hypothetical protein